MIKAGTILFYSKTACIYIMLLAFLSCAESPKKQGGLYFTTDIDAMIGWSFHPTIYRTEKAHSGEYVSKTDTSNIYSVTFDIPNSAVNQQYSIVREVKATAWILMKSSKAKATFVTEVRKYDQMIHWSGIKVQDLCPAHDQWFKVEKILTLSKDLNGNDCHFRLYLVNDAKDDVYIDDITVEYLY
jgi:hypothetical protein